jgi:cysteine desulfurase / selenocysteine lyase
MEHNSVMRPLRFLEKQGSIDLSVVKCDSQSGIIDAKDVRKNLRPATRLITVLHASNVTGALQPVKEIGAIAREAEIPFLVDASQTAGAFPIDIEQLNIDMLAFTGHKSLLGPTGTGGLYIREALSLRPISFGGTGSRSEQEFQPEFMPDIYESGTLNVVGLAGLGAGIRYLLDVGVENVYKHEKLLSAHFFKSINDEIKVYCPSNLDEHIGVISFNVRGMSPSEVGLMLDQAFNIMVRVGLHCSPAAHKTIGTFPDGTIRFGFSLFNSLEEIDVAVKALELIIKEKTFE